CLIPTGGRCRKEGAAIQRRRLAIGSGADGDALLFEDLLQLAGLVHLAYDVAAADELTLDIELRDRRPVREFLDPLTDPRVGKDVDTFELDPDVAQDLYHRRGEAALRKDR